MMRSLFSGVAGLKGHQTRMDVIGNNIANVNTTGFKSGRVTFADTLNQTVSGASAPNGNIGGTNPKQIGLGVGVATIDTLFTDGSVQSTGKNTDLCISGNGLFVVKTGDETYYTRNGAFEFDANGNYVMPGSGMRVQGYMAVNGDLSNAAGTPDGDIKIEVGKSMDAKATTIASYTKNLQANMTGYTINNMIVKYADGTQETVSNYSPTKVYDGVVSLTTSTGKTITLDDTADYNFTTGDSLAGKTLWTSTVNSVTASDTGLVDVQIEPGGNVMSITGLSQITGLTSGTYKPGGTYTLTGTINTNGVTAADTLNNVIDVTFTLDSNHGTSSGSIVTVRIPRPESGSYSDGDNVSFNVSIPSAPTTGSSIVAHTGATVNCANGLTDTVQSDLNVSANTSYVRQGRAEDGTIVTISREGKGSAYIYNNKKVDSISVVTTDGTALNGLLGKEYSGGDTFYSSITTTVNVYDSDSGVHSIPVLFTRKAGTESTWDLSLAGGSDSYSLVEEDGTTVEVALTKNDLVFDGAGNYVSGDASLAISYSGDRAVDDATISLNLSGLTQYAAKSSTISNESDGNSYGTLKSVSIDSTGVITGIYTNGVKQSEAKIAIATFNNIAGLTKTGNSLYQESNNSGQVSYDNSGSTITASALEMSNVDIANEFSDMIITQRGFQSNSKVITVGDEMLETLINMKR